MFDRFIRLARAKRALHDERFEDALQLAHDPLIAADRRAEALQRAATAHIVARARRRLLGGDLAAARVDVDRLRRFVSSEIVAVLAGEVDAATARAEAGQALAQQQLAEARRLLAAGETAAASALLAGLEDSVAREGDALRRHLVERLRDATEIVAGAADCIANGAIDSAVERLRRAEALDRDGPASAGLRMRLEPLVLAAIVGQVRALMVAEDLLGAVRRFQQAAAEWPVLRTREPMIALAAGLAKTVVAGLCAAPTIEHALPLARAVDAAAFVVSADVQRLVVATLATSPAAGELARGSSEPGQRYQALAEAAQAVGASSLAACAARLVASAATGEQRLSAARQRIDHGQLDEARDLLAAFLVESPMHEGARRELELVERGLLDLEQRLTAARTALRSGRLRQACAAAQAIGGSARVTTEAQQLVAEARARMALVDRGLDEVRVALHGRVAASHEGIQHCLKRLEELAKVQVDHTELAALIAGVQVELRALTMLERVSAAIDARQGPMALAELLEVVAVRPALLSADRLDARLCEHADQVVLLADAMLAAGRVSAVEAMLSQFADLAVVRPDFTRRADALAATCGRRRAAAAALLADATLRLHERDLAEAERMVEEALRQWTDAPEARAMAAELASLRHQSEVLERVADLTKERDYLGAGQKLSAIPVASPYLRTRIYDMKQNLARAQGLEGAFLLRVDEGGEHLVLRHESVTIGNVRQARADVPILAQLAGRHASIRRSMSFHGGMQDTVVAEEGEVTVRGARVPAHVLSQGDRVLLGSALSFVYERPTARSLTALLRLQTGFQVAGTDRLLLMKDRGRDGRLLLGSGKDVHVRVARATGEVEIFATPSGQIRLFSEGGGTIDGVPFRGDHPLAAGQIVEASGISFTLLPWRPTV